MSGGTLGGPHRQDGIDKRFVKSKPLGARMDRDGKKEKIDPLENVRGIFIFTAAKES